MKNIQRDSLGNANTLVVSLRNNALYIKILKICLPIYKEQKKLSNITLHLIVFINLSFDNTGLQPKDSI